MEDVDIDHLGSQVRELQKIIFEIEFFGEVQLTNGHIYNITEDKRSYHSFYAIKRLDNPVGTDGFPGDLMFVTHGAPPEILYDFVSDFDDLFVSVQREKIRCALLTVDDQGEQLYRNIVLKADSLLSRYADGNYIENLLLSRLSAEERHSLEEMQNNRFVGVDPDSIGNAIPPEELKKKEKLKKQRQLEKKKGGKTKKSVKKSKKKVAV